MNEKCKFCDAARRDGKKTCGKSECLSKLLKEVKRKAGLSK